MLAVITLALCLLTLTGFALMRLALPAAPLLAALASPLLGVILWALLLNMALILNVPWPFQASACALVICGLVSIAFAQRAKPFNARDLAFFALVGVTASSVVVSNTYGTNIGDAGYMIMMGVDIGRYETFPEDVQRELFYAYPLLLPLLQASAYWLIGSDHFISPAPMIAILLMAFLSVLFIKIGFHWIIGILTALLLFSSAGMMIHAFYFNNHLLLAFVILVFAYVAEVYRLSRCPVSILVLAILLMGLPLIRLEGSLIAIILMVVFIRQSGFTVIERLILGVGSAVATTIFFGHLLTFEPGSWSLNILSPASVKIIILLSWLYVLYILAAALIPLVRKLDNSGPLLIVALACIAVLITCILAPARTAASILALAVNLFGFGGLWGITWWLLVLGLIAVWQPTVARGALTEDPRFVAIVALLALMILFLLSRDAYQIGFGDTLNRSMVHVLPIWAWLVMDRWRKACQERQTGLPVLPFSW